MHLLFTSLDLSVKPEFERVVVNGNRRVEHSVSRLAGSPCVVTLQAKAAKQLDMVSASNVRLVRLQLVQSRFLQPDPGVHSSTRCALVPGQTPQTKPANLGANISTLPGPIASGAGVNGLATTANYFAP